MQEFLRLQLRLLKIRKECIDFATGYSKSFDNRTKYDYLRLVDSAMQTVCSALSQDIISFKQFGILSGIAGKAKNALNSIDIECAYRMCI